MRKRHIALCMIFALLLYPYPDAGSQEKASAVQRVVFGVKIVQPARVDSVQAGTRKRKAEASGKMSTLQHQTPRTSELPEEQKPDGVRATTTHEQKK